MSGANGSRKKTRLVSHSSEEEVSDSDDLELKDEPEVEVTGSRQTQKPMELHDSGTIARVEVVNFMCHKYLKVDFGPKMNFVIGHNGSGKSAILTAITIALGAKANSTNRGKNLSSLIREGANAAEVTVRITNKGPDAFRHEIYGDFIQVERKIMKDGIGGYKIKNASGKTISTKRDELTAICDHMSIQVDNPLIVLSQDNARQFLNSSSPQDKYKLFMRGTQLAQLFEDYNVVRESMDTAKATIERKKQYLPDLYKKAKETERRYKEILETREIESKIDDLNNELVWAQIINKEKEVENARKDVTLAQKQIDATKEKIAVSNNKIGRFIEEIQEVQVQIDNFRNNNKPNLEEKRKLATEKISQETRVHELQADIREINEYFKQSKNRLKRCEQNLAAEMAKLESNNQSKRDAITEKIKELDESKHTKLKKKEALQSEIIELERRQQDAQEQKNEVEQKLSAASHQRDELKKRIINLRAQKEDKMRAYGQSMPEVLKDIEAETRWKMGKPVGPFGAYITLNYPEYADVLELVLNRQMISFVVQCFEDKALLSRILQRRRMDQTPIVIAKRDLFDYSEGEPDEKYLTILRALTFKDEWVKRQLIISSNIEQTLLMSDRAEADKVMYNRPWNIKKCYTSKGHSVGAKQGMRTDALPKMGGPSRFKTDVEPEIRKAETQFKEICETGRRLKEEYQKYDDAERILRGKVNACRNAIYQTDNEVRQVNNEIQRLKDSIKEDEPVNIAAFEQEKEELERERKVYVKQFTEVNSDLQAVQDALDRINQRLGELNGDENQQREKLRSFQEEIQKIEEMKLKEMQNKNALQERLDQRITRLESFRNVVLQLEKTCEEWKRQAQDEYPERVETKLTPQELQRKIEHLEVLREEKEKAVGGSLEEVEKEAKDALMAWSEAKSTLSSMEVLLHNLKKTLDERMVRWDNFRMYMSLSAMGHFTYYMHKRGDSGQLRFYHEKERLEIRVATGDQFRKGGSRKKDSKSLSGGEKSFSQISLLLSLWHGIASPILCLDEFDVYMDAVNRKQSMKMMLDSASENSSQYILITPQEASNMQPGPLVTIHRLADPERRQ
ncbi:Structural maintenance of chromosomes protein 6 [Apophysomyces ossiformis]|uniref:Structural maintenance of chromosomes protein 6 n=1 Tax=Apophysomyces ossiformis TaxID=679940 RepID=A0A8H7BIM8_9FUNG|nr:Structural maintenance of chromosomes protein 6 [Apophysomyces ossiformis]